MPAQEKKVVLQAIRRQRATKFAGLLRNDVQARLRHLLLDCVTDEERRDIQRLLDLMNDICEKHERRAERHSPFTVERSVLNWVLASRHE
jgi:uncharacterized protein with von Willebrand factor type A (vWA) domain